MKKILLAILVVLLTGCSSGLVESNTPTEAVTNYYKYYHTFAGANSDFSAWMNYNRSEILQSLEVEELHEIKTHDVALALVRYNVGSETIKQGVWLRQIKQKWFKAEGSAMLEYDPMRMGFSEQTSELKALLKKAKDWQSQNPPVWWLNFFY